MTKLCFYRVVLLATCLATRGTYAQTSLKTELTAEKQPVPVPPDIQRAIDSMELLAQKAPDQNEKIRLYGKICWSYLDVSRLDLAKKYADTVMFLAQRSKDSLGIYKAYYYYGVMARLAGDYAEALRYLEAYVSFYEKRGDSSKVAGVLYQIGSVQSNLGNYEKSLEAYYRLIPIEQKDGNDYSVGYTLNAIGTVLKETKKFEDAEKALANAYVIFDTLDEKWDKTFTLVNLGNLYTDLGQLEKAKQRYEEALVIDRQIGKLSGVALSLANIAFVYDKMGKYDSALIYHLEALKIREELPGKEGLGRSLIGVGRGYRQLKNYMMAKHFLQRGLELVSGMQSKPMLIDVYENLSQVYAAEGNYAKAYEYQLLFTNVKDSVLGEKTTAQLNELQAKYETGEKDKKILMLANERQAQQRETERQLALKKTFIAGLIIVTLLAGSAVYIFMQRLKNQKVLSAKDDQIREVNFKRQMAELEMKALRAQINPHFLFNCMNSINRMILNGDADKASMYLTKFSKLVRLILENTETQKVLLVNELALLESYIQLEGLRFKGKINYEISVEESIEPENTYLPSMVLQPFVENAIWHGLLHKQENERGNISISIKEQHDRLLCTIEDNGVGREKARQLREKSVLKSRSMGMKITEDRLKLLNENGSEPVIWITDLKDSMDHAAGTRIEINIPIS